MNKEFQKIKRKMNTYATIHITGRCNINCRHCFESNLVGHRQLQDAKQEDVIRWIKQIAATKSIRSISFVGGEPFLCLDDLVNYIKCAKDVGLSSSVVTNGYWATSAQSVDRMLNKLSGLNSIMVSSDKYHLEFVDKELVDNLVNGCIKKNINVVIHITAANKKEGEEIKRLYSNSYSKHISILISPMFTWDYSPENTKIKEQPQQNIEVEKFNYMDQPELLNNHCQIGCPMVNTCGEVYMCHGSQIADTAKTNFFYLGNLMNETYEDIIKRKDESLLYNFLDNYGTSGLAKIINESFLKNEFSKMEFSQPCHMCIWALDNKDFYNYIINSLEKV